MRATPAQPFIGPPISTAARRVWRTDAGDTGPAVHRSANLRSALLGGRRPFTARSPAPGTVGRMGRVVAIVTGWVLLLAGVVMFPLPGPGLLLGVAGLGILARQQEWAARRVDRLRLRVEVGAARGVRTHPRAWASILVTAGLAASGALWLWAPAQPGWWALPAWTWLPGGVTAGISQIVSGLVSLALVVHSYRRYHGRPDELARLETLSRDATARR